MKNQECFDIISPTKKPVPFLLSIPHSGTKFPAEKQILYDKKQVKKLDDTDWFLEHLYDFAASLGITTIKANYHRWLIDLNRDPKNKALYDDGRIITSICPETNFLGEKIYIEGCQPSSVEISKRIEKYFLPYHNKIDELIAAFLKTHKKVFFWDAHSISRYVPTIQPNPFPDLIIGDNNGLTCQKKLTEICQKMLGNSNFDLNYNKPFKGGYLTRSKGNPNKKINAIQLEMSKDLYMNEKTNSYKKNNPNNIKSLLKDTFKEIIKEL